MPTTIALLTPLSTPAPNRGMTEAEFAPAADTFAGEVTEFVPEINISIGQMNALAGELQALATAADVDAAAAQQAALDAAVSAGAPIWAAATNWATGAVVRDPANDQLYTRLTPGGVQATAPNVDVAGAGTYWRRTQIYAVAPPRIVSAAKTFAIDDAFVAQHHPASDVTARTWTIPANASVAIPVGSIIPLFNETGAGVITIAITTDTLRLAGTAGVGSRTLAANGIATLYKFSATVWMITGTGLT